MLKILACLILAIGLNISRAQNIVLPISMFYWNRPTNSIDNIIIGPTTKIYYDISICNTNGNPTNQYLLRDWNVLNTNIVINSFSGYNSKLLNNRTYRFYLKSKLANNLGQSDWAYVDFLYKTNISLSKPIIQSSN
jgi:hypothetical protein